MSAIPAGLEEWIEEEARFAASAMGAAISATHIVKHRPGFGSIITPRPGSIVASPVLASYDPDPDYFFHWFRDSAIVIDALRVSLAEGWADARALDRFREFVAFGRSLLALDGADLVRRADLREKTETSFLQYLRADAEIAAVSGQAVLAEARVNPDATLDFTRWARPQTDGPALRILALMRWLRAGPAIDDALSAGVAELVRCDVDFTLCRADEPSFDIWEEERGRHYYTQLAQAEALGSAAGWLAENGDETRARACRIAAAEILARLGAFWDARAGYYLSRIGVAGGRSEKALDIAVVLAIVRAGRAAGPHSILDPKAQATLAALEEHFESEYAINHSRAAGFGPALGRYPNDVYYSGGAYYFATLGAAEFYFKLAHALLGGATMPVTEENERFRRRLAIAEEKASGQPIAAAALKSGDAIMETVRRFTPASGELSEQFDRTTGAQTSAKQLAWSYAAFITAAASRRRPCLAIRGSGLGERVGGRG